jgi:hypothetical protein
MNFRTLMSVLFFFIVDFWHDTRVELHQRLGNDKQCI